MKDWIVLTIGYDIANLSNKADSCLGNNYDHAVNNKGRDSIGKVILALSDQLIHKMNDFQSLKKGELTISVSPFYQKCYLLGVLSEFQKRHFGIKVRIVDAFSSDSETLLVQGQVDLAFVMLPYQNKSIKVY